MTDTKVLIGLGAIGACTIASVICARKEKFAAAGLLVAAEVVIAWFTI